MLFHAKAEKSWAIARHQSEWERKNQTHHSIFKLGRFRVSLFKWIFTRRKNFSISRISHSHLNIFLWKTLQLFRLRLRKNLFVNFSRCFPAEEQKRKNWKPFFRNKMKFIYILRGKNSACIFPHKKVSLSENFSFVHRRKGRNGKAGKAYIIFLDNKKREKI